MEKKRFIKKIGIRFVAFGLLFGLCGCEKKEEQVVQKDIFAMDTYMTITAYGEGAETGIAEAEEKIKQIEAICSVTDEQSEVYQINQQSASDLEALSEANTKLEISNELADLIKIALKMGEKTTWDFDISIYPVLRAWGFTTNEYQVPKEEELQKLLEKVAGKEIILEEKLDNYYLTIPSGMLIDFGGIAKGYAADVAAQALKNAGVKSAILNLGGNIQTIGEKTDKSSWNIAIKDPKKTEQYAGVLQIKEKAVVTSGGYERYFEDKEGNIWTHIIDTENGYPADTDLLSVTIVGDEGAVCDALSTALYVKGLDEASNYWREQGGFEAIFITDKQEVYVTKGLKDNFSLLGDYEDKKINVIE